MDLARASAYDLLWDSYYGTGGFQTGDYLVKHKREKDENYRERKVIAYYLNYVRPVVNSHVDPVFRTEPAREWQGPGSVLWEKFISDVDKNGSSLTRFMKRAGLIAKLMGVAFIVLDNFKEHTLNVSEAISSRTLPYTYIVSPNRVTSFLTDQYGNLASITYTEQDQEGQVNYRTWTSKGWILKDSDGKVVEEGKHPLGRVPVIPLFSRPMNQGEMLPISEFYPIAKTNARLFNLCSELDEILRNQAFAVLIYPDTGKGISSLTLGPNNALGFDGENSRHTPAFIAPPADPSNLLMAQIDRLVKEIYRMAMLTHVTGVQEQKTGVAKAWDFEQTNTALTDFADNCEGVEIEMAKVFSLWVNQDLAYQCNYSDDYSIQDVEQELKEATQALDMQIGGRFDVEVKKKVTAIYLQDLPTEDYDAVIEDIENQSQDEEMSKAMESSLEEEV